MHFLEQKIQLLANVGSARKQSLELLHVAAQAGEFFAHVAAFGRHRRFLRDARRIQRGLAQKILQPQFQPPRESRTSALRERFDLSGKSGDASQPRLHLFAQMIRLVLAHAVEFVERLHQATRDHRFQAGDLFFERRRGRPDHSRQPQDRGQVRLRFDGEFLPQRVDRLQICRRYFAVHAHRRGARQVIVQRDIEMPAPHSLAHDLADARLDGLEALGHAQVQVEEAVIHAAHRNTQAPSILDGLRLRVPGHGAQGFRTLLTRLWGCFGGGL